MSKHDIGLVGLAVMGQNLVLNMANHGYSVGVFNRTTSVPTILSAVKLKSKRLQDIIRLKSWSIIWQPLAKSC